MDRGKLADGTVVTDGRNIAIVTFDLQVAGTARPGAGHRQHRHAVPISPHRKAAPISTVDKTDTATVTIASPAIAKTLSDTNQAHTSGNNVAIGEIITYEVDGHGARGHHDGGAQ